MQKEPKKLLTEIASQYTFRIAIHTGRLQFFASCASLPWFPASYLSEGSSVDAQARVCAPERKDWARRFPRLQVSAPRGQCTVSLCATVGQDFLNWTYRTCV